MGATKRVFAVMAAMVAAAAPMAQAGQFLRQGTAATVKIGPFLDDTDGKTSETGLTLSQADVRLSKNGGDYAQKNDASACTHDELGEYACPLDATDTATLGRLRLIVHESGALPVWHDFMVVPANVYDSLFGADTLEVDTVAVEGGDATDAVRDSVVDDATRIDGSRVNACSIHSVGDVWDRLLADIAAANSIGKLIKDYLDAAVSSRATPADVEVIVGD